ncbi:hypothetical protein Hoch_4157 [Haliangium ochraceum DSM 14365]|uniref:HEAT repeat domain-containing protein n=1 Tax=Haliangium ochraceum (strain DSM 14365 / JCM 11303 / SMP-2) TaxID=502025 RepID=D0LKT5_HALO1|nr:hypothetical protein Hoch_4157 [Haliangium ochraceum DSM 14365]
MCAALLSPACKRPPEPEPELESARAERDAGAAATEEAPVSRAHEEQIVITDIAVQNIGEVERELFERELAKRLGRALVASGTFVGAAELAEDGRRPRQARVLVRMAHDVRAAATSGVLTVSVALDGALLWLDEDARDPAPWDRLVAERLVDANAPAADHDGLVAVLASGAIEQMGMRLAERERVRAGGAGAIAGVLGDDQGDPSAALWALDLAAYFATVDAFDAVAGALEHPASQVRERAAAVLVGLDRGRALARLTEQVRFDDVDSMRVVIDAAAAEGGDDARAYLEFVASGHPDASLQARARAGLDALAPAPSNASP